MHGPSGDNSKSGLPDLSTAPFPALVRGVRIPFTVTLVLKQYDNVESALMSRKYSIDPIRPFLRRSQCYERYR